MAKFVCVFSAGQKVPLGTIIEASYLLNNNTRFELSLPIIYEGEVVQDTNDTMPVNGNLWRWEEVKNQS
jgi:hypothetical protein